MRTHPFFGLALVCALASALSACHAAPPPKRGAAAGWPAVGGNAFGQRFSPLDEIDATNVEQLEVAWTYRTGDVAPGRYRTAFQATPVLYDGGLYFCSPYGRIFAIDAESGAERWVHDPGVDMERERRGSCRGLAVAPVPGRASDEACAVSVLHGTIDARLVAVDARTGTPCPEFGDAGVVDLTQGLGDVREREYGVTSPPTVVGDIVVLGAMVSDNKRVDSPPGVVRAFDIATGALRWAFDPVAPGTPPPDPGSGARWHRGTPNAWSLLSADPERGLVFVPTGNPSNDFYRGGRDDIDHYGSSVVALDATDGRVVWHFQTVHHDLWDYDVGTQPTLVPVRRGDETIPALVQATKMGHVFILDRETGIPIHPVEERAVPASHAPGERAAATQPFPTQPPPLHPGGLAPEDVFGLTPYDRGACRSQLAQLRNEGVFTPPSLEGSVQYPGVAGGANWGGVAVDPAAGIAVVNQTHLAVVQRLIPRAQLEDTEHDPPREILFPQGGAPYGVLQSVLLSPFGIPCSPPPWSTLSAFRLDTGELLWQVPFGTTRSQAPWPFWFDWGIPGMGGPIVTGSGLVFIGAAMDGLFRAIDLATGQELWSDALPAGGQATPMTYRVRDGGRQMVVIAAGGHATLGTELGDWLVAYALPE